MYQCFIDCSDDDNDLEKLKEELETEDLLKLSADVKAGRADEKDTPQVLICGVCLGIT